jgi:hypothetical protein
MVVVVVAESQQSFAKCYGEEEGYEGEEGQRRGVLGCGDVGLNYVGISPKRKG